MREEAMVVLSTLVDGEEITDLSVLAEALEAAEGRAVLLEFVRLRSAVRMDESRPGPSFYEHVLPIITPHGRWSRPRVVRSLAAAAVLVLGLAGLMDLGFRLRGTPAAEQPPRATRVLRFEPGVDWHTSAR
jgi:hypothetical protein